MEKWQFPLSDWKGMIPLRDHPGSFGAFRSHDRHTGVDLYTDVLSPVYAVESGVVVEIEDFTGPNAGSPWWLPTKSIMIEGSSGVVCYGEVEPVDIKKGDVVLVGQLIAHVIPVLQEGKERQDIPGHSRFMLHLELYETGTRQAVWWKLGDLKPENLLDPTQKLIEAYHGT